MRAFALIGCLVLFAAACSDDVLMGGPADRNAGPRGCFEAVTDQFLISPATLARGEVTDIVVTWRVFGSLVEPAMLFLQQMEGGNVTMEVELQLERSPSVYGEYSATLLNPFGVGASPGPVGVRVAEDPDYCRPGLSESGGIVLQ